MDVESLSEIIAPGELERVMRRYADIHKNLSLPMLSAVISVSGDWQLCTDIYSHFSKNTQSWRSIGKYLSVFGEFETDKVTVGSFLYCRIRWVKDPFVRVPISSFEGQLTLRILDICKRFVAHYPKATIHFGLVVYALVALKVVKAGELASYLSRTPECVYSYPHSRLVRRAVDVGIFEMIKIPGEKGFLVFVVES